MKPVLFSALALAALLATGCKDDDDDAAGNSPSARAALLTGKRWTLTTLTSQESGSTTIEDGYAQLEPCERDNTVQFNADNSATVDEGATRCGTSDPQTYSGRWELVANESRLLLSTPLYGSGVAAQPEIMELTANRLVLRATVNDDGAVTTATATLTAQ